MKKYIITIVLASTLFLGCSKDGETTLQAYNKIIYSENFNSATDNTILDIPGWTNTATVGTKLWSEQVFSGNGYAEFSSFASGQSVNVSWLISPKINMDNQEGEVLTFMSAPNFLFSRLNSLEILVSTNYNGTNAAAADWILMPAITPVPEDERFTYISSGQIDLSSFKGNLNFAFRVKGSGTNFNLRGTYQIDNVLMFYKVQE